ncbi:MAG: hypothetical protein JWO71_1149 [Candidatus Acidoferrum typicum]|nr:hypothetical protein [Candidatus Acidoferrum typicum]
MKKLICLPALLLFCSSALSQTADVLVQRYDNGRTGQNLAETALTVSNVNTSTFGKLYTLRVDGYVYAQPLYKSNVVVPGKGTFNMVFIATEHDSVYAFDADSATPIWQTSFINAAAGITTQPAGDTGTNDIIPEVGITSTPVIDPVGGTLYTVAKTKENGSAVFRIHALDITTGAERVPSLVIQATVGSASFDANWQQQRPGLVLINGVVYVGFGSSGDRNTWRGWVLGYSLGASSFTQAAKFCTEPSSIGGGLWASGAAPDVDPNGNIYISTGNGNFNGTTNFGDSFVKFSTPTLAVLDFFAPFNQSALSAADLDIASVGSTLLPDSLGTTAHPHLMVAGGKDGTIYLLDRDNMGHFNGSYTNPDSQIVQEIWNQIGAHQTNPAASSLAYVQNNYTTPGVWRNHVYWCGIDDVCKMFDLNNGLLTTTPVSRGTKLFPFGGGQPIISAASPSATSAIMWAVENGSAHTILHAYDATNLANELFNSDQAASNRDVAGLGVKFVNATVTNGKVFVGSQGQVDTYGLLASIPSRAPAPTFNPPQGTYTTTLSVAISDADTAATIYYTVDGSVPTASSSVYTGPIPVSVTTTITAIAVRPGYLTSPVTPSVYTIGTLTSTGGFVQGNYATPHGNIPLVTVPFTSPQGPGDLNVVVVGWNDTTATVTAVTDTMNNQYVLAVGPTTQSVVGSQSIYYAKNILAAGANANSVSVTFSGVGGHDPDIRIAEYSGLDRSNPVDAVAASQGTSTNSDSGPATTTSPTELIIGANLVQTSTPGPGPGFNNRMITVPDSDILEDKVVTAVGSYNATAPVSPSAQWIMQMVAFRAAPNDTIPPTAPSNLIGTAPAPNRIDLSWTASTDNIGVTAYVIERCSGTGCSAFTPLATINGTSTTYSDIRTYPFLQSQSYRVLAQDAAGNSSPYSNVVSVTAPPDTTPPTAPTNLVATPVSGTQINLSWTASTDNVGVSSYNLERCVGAGCTNFAIVANPIGPSVSDTGVVPSTTYSYRVWAVDSAGNASGYSNIAVATTPATAPPPPTITSLNPTSGPIGTSVTITGTNFGTQTGSSVSFSGTVATPTSWSATSIVAPVPSGAITGNVVVTVNGVASNGIAFTVTSTGGVKLVQHILRDAGTTTSSSLAFASNNVAGNWIGVVIRAGKAGQVFTVSDTKTNTYKQAVKFDETSDGHTLAIFYAENIASGPNTITVSDTISGTLRFAILEYSGVALTNSLDGIPAAAHGASTSPNSGNVTTTANGDLLLGAVATANSASYTAGTGFTIRDIVSSKLISEDQTQTIAGPVSATTSLAASDIWSAALAAFKTGAPLPIPTAPTNLSATAAGPDTVNLSWTAATETGGTISQYLIERCIGASCSNFTQVGTSTSTAYSDIGTLGSTSYSYRVRAQDAANTKGPYSSVATAVTSAPTFTAPSNLAAVSSGPAQINISWAAGTEVGGTISQYLVERCTGANCGNTPSNFAQVGTSTTTAFSDTGLLGSTSYSYRVRATDASANLSAYSNIVTATTGAPTFTAPSNLTSTASGSTQINLTWTAGTETGGTITQYLIERCQGVNCGNTPSNFAQVNTSATTSFSDTGLTASTSYSYRVRSTDASNNLGPYSNISSATTSTNSPTAPSSLTATPAGPVQINLAWGASTESGGTVSQYLIERCAGVGCANTPANFAQVGTSAGLSFNDAGLLGSTSYSYRVRAQDTLNNNGPYSNIAVAVTAAPTFTPPSNLAATASGPVQINLAWTAATETGGTLTQYLVERCLGATCSNFAQVGTSATTTYNDTSGLLGSTAYNYRVRATDAANNLSAYSNTSSATTGPPVFTAPSNLTAAPVGSTQINLSWTAATETGGTISQYLVESCQGSGCSNFAQVGTSASATFSNTGLLAGTTYSYRVRATDAANNLGPYSNVAGATTSVSQPVITFVQGNFATPQSSPTSVTVTFTAAQIAGDLNVVVIGWNNSTATLSGVTDTLGNPYTQALAPTVQSGTASQVIYYAKNIVAAAAGANQVTVTFSGPAAFPDVRVLEYAGIDTVSPLDVAIGAQGNNASSSSGAVTTTNANDLIIGANLVQTITTGAGAGFTSRMITTPDGDIVEDRIVTATGSYTAIAPVSPSGQWIMQLVSFKRHP